MRSDPDHNRNILFGDDGSASADLAWRWINSQHWGDGWTVHVLSAEPELVTSDEAAHRWESPDPRAPVDPTSGLRIVHERVEADPRFALCEAEDVDLMVIGPRGRGLMKSLHLGSTAEWLMHHPPHPMVIVRRGGPVERVVLCADGSRHSRGAARVLAALPWVSRAEVEVLTVVENSLDAPAVAESTAEILRGRAGNVTTRVLGPDELDVFYHVRDIILGELRDRDADLVVQGSRGLSAWQGLRAGSIASSLAAHAPCSVLMTHVQDDADPC